MPVVQVVESRRHTAEIFADPALAAALSEPTDGDFGSAPDPEVR
ncbi:hypothetical protein [Nocardia thailandica]